MSNTKKPIPDDDFERDLAALSRSYRAAKGDEPPREIDDAIRAAARRAVHAGPQAQRRNWMTTWATPVATAAMLVLTVSIGLVSYRERPDLATTEVRSEPPARPQAPTAVPAQVPEPAAASLPASPAASPPARAKSAVAPPMPFSNVAPAMDKLRAQAPAAAREEVKRERAADANVRESFVPAPAPAPAAAPAAKDSAMLEKRTYAAPASAAPEPQAAPALAAPPARSDMQSSERAAPAAAGASAGLMVQKAKEEKTERTPEAWLKDITELRRDGKLKEALEELEKFRKRFPDYALPPELKDLR
jgi:hypothetical protein